MFPAPGAFPGLGSFRPRSRAVVRSHIVPGFYNLHVRLPALSLLVHVYAGSQSLPCGSRSLALRLHSLAFRLLQLAGLAAARSRCGAPLDATSAPPFLPLSVSQAPGSYILLPLPAKEHVPML